MRAELHTLRESLSKFPETVGESLPKRIKSADDLHNRARKVAKGNLGELKRFASKHGYGPLQVARNLVATANAKELEILRDLLTSWNQESPLEPASEFRSLCATLPRPGRRITMARWMLLEGRLPARTIAIDYFSGNLQQILDFERVVLRDQSGSLSSANTVSILRAVCSWDLDKFPKNTRALLSAEGFAKDLAQLDEVAFRKVPQRIRRWILEDHDFSASALTADYHDRVRSDPLAFPDSPEAIREQVWISREFPATLQALSSRSFFDLDLQALFQRPNFDECDDQILMALRRRRISSYWDSSCMLLKLPDHGLSAASSRLRNALAFFSRPVEQRLSVAEELSEEEVTELIIDVTRKDWTTALQKCSSPSALSRIKDLVLADQDLRSALMQRLHEKKTSPACLQVLARNYFDGSDVTGWWKLVSHKPALLGSWQVEDLGHPQCQQIIEIHGRKPAGFCTIFNNVPAKVSRHLLRSKEPWIQSWRSAVSKDARRSRSTQFRRRFLLYALRHSPVLIQDAFEWRVSNGDFAFLAESLMRGSRPLTQPALLQLIDARGKPHWESLLRNGKRAKKLKELIRAKRPDLLERFEEIEVEPLLRDPKIRRELRKVLHGKAPARSLELPQRTLRHFIPWARKTWRKKPTMAVAYELALAFSIRDAQYLLFLCSKRWLSEDRDRGGVTFDDLYHTWTLPKKSGGKRLVTAPEQRLKRLQRRILRNGFDREFIHPAAHGFAQGRSILTNAQVHAGQPCIVNVDIEAFFPNTSHQNILRACSYALGGKLSHGARRVLADICSYGGGLPTGAPTSPAIANLVLRSADTSIFKAAKANGIRYTRYADDLTFSGESNVLQILPFVKKVLSQLGYRLDPKKTNIFRRGRRQVVTGLVVNETPNLPRRIRRRLRAAVHHRSNGNNTHWHGRPMSHNELIGRLAWLQLVQPGEAKSLKQKLKEASAP